MNKFDFHSASELLRIADTHGMTLGEVALNDATYDQGQKMALVKAEMQKRIDVITNSVKDGLEIHARSRSGLSGGDAFRLNKMSVEDSILGGVLHKAVTYSLAITESNAMNGKIVACPTAGSAGVLPAALIALMQERKLTEDDLVMGMFAAGSVGIVIAENAMIAGATGGCQAELGTAAAMAAAGLGEMLGLHPDMCTDAAAIALKGMLGLVCDPIAGLVECPCVKRNAIAVGNAFIAVEMVMAGIKSNVPLDEVIGAMKEIGVAMHPKYKETAEGGIAATKTGRMVEKTIFSK